jgi:hypothetical protein
VHSVPTPAERARVIVEIVAILAAGLWALYTFVYVQEIKPLSEPASFAVPTLVDQGATINGVVFLTIHKRLENTGNVPIDIAAEAFSVYGEKIVQRTRRVQRIETPTSAKVTADVPRVTVALLYSMAKLRNGAVGGNPKSGFFTLPHSSADENFLIAVPVNAYPVILIVRKDYVAKAPIVPKIPVQIIRTPLGGYDLRSKLLQGEYDNILEYPIRPQ